MSDESEGLAGRPVEPSAGGETPDAGHGRRRLWRPDSLAVEGVLGLALVSALLLLGALLVMSLFGKRLVVEESKRKIEQAGNRRVEELGARSREVAAVARTLADLLARAPKDSAAIESLLPPLLDFQGDEAIAGGGFWPEPRLFDPAVERRGFFWGRDQGGGLKLFEDYNDPLGPGYHNEEWYVPARFEKAGDVFWSRSYTEPYSYQPMVTCAAPVIADGLLLGVATVDLKLDGLRDLVEQWQATLGGYGFLLDRENRFLSFPQPEKVKDQRLDEKGNPVAEFIHAEELVARDGRFRPIATALREMDDEVLALAREQPGYDPGLAARIDAASYQIDAHEAQIIAATVVDPLAERRSQGGDLMRTLELSDDVVIGKPALAFLFHVPGSYWKLVVVTPRDAAEAVATRISRYLVLALAAIILPVLLLGYLFLARKLIRPVTTLAEAAQAVRDGDLGVAVEVVGRDELGQLAASFNQMVGQLRDNTACLEQANRELERSLQLTDTIMGNVNEGLFLLQPNLEIAPRYSTALEQILGARDLAGQRFLDLIRQITPEKTLELTDRFLKLLFNPAKTDSVIAKINPLREVEASFPGPQGQLEQRYLNFHFDRVWEGGSIRYAMATVVDATSRVLLAQQLKDSQQRLERQGELLLAMMHVEPGMLRDFIDGAHHELERINDTLREGRGEGLADHERQAVYRRVVDQIFTSIHSIKGTAAMLHIDYLAAAAHRFEEKLNQLRGRARLDGNDFLPVVLELSEMIDSLVEIRQVMHRFSAVARPAEEAAKSDADLLATVLERFVDDLAGKHGKKAALRFEAAEQLQIPFRVKSPLRNVMAQLARNSLVHGIETPAERLAAGKPESGTIRVTARVDGGQLTVTFRDDGRGVDYRHLVEKAKELARSEPGLLETLVDREHNRWRLDRLDELLFHPGLSTASEASEDAGRGYGLAAARREITSLGGRIQLRHRPGQFCEVLIQVPLGVETAKEGAA